METYYSVTLNGISKGKISAKRQGLYYHFSCSCSPDIEGIYRLMVTCGDNEESLGILVPSDGAFVLNTKCPVKRIGEGNMSFRLISSRETSAGTFVPISPEEPFAYISRLKESFLILRDGQPGIQISKMQE